MDFAILAAIVILSVELLIIMVVVGFLFCRRRGGEITLTL